MKNIIFKNNIISSSDSMLSLKGYYLTSKDEKVVVETKDINREKKIDIRIRGFETLNDANKVAEILSILLIDENGFTRPTENISIEKQKGNKVTISLK